MMDINHSVFLGSYYQSDSSVKEPIEWIVIEKSDNCATLISKMILFEEEFNTQRTPKWTWLESSLRSFLNTEFVNEAFSDEDKGALVADADGSLVFILTCQQASTLMTEEQRAATMTPYARSKGIYRDNYWWVASKGYSSSDTIIVKADGYLNGDAYDRFSTSGCGVRPCVRIKI